MHVRAFAVIVTACSLLACLHAQSQPPTPGGRKLERSQPQRQPEEVQRQPSANPRGTDESPVVVKIQPTLKTHAEADDEKRKEDAEAAAHWWTVALGIATGILGVLQLGAIGFQVRLAFRQNKIIEQQSAIMAGQRQAADKQSEHMRDGLEISRLSVETTRAIERGYVSIEAMPPGVRFPMGSSDLVVRVTNHGHTPTRITDLKFRAFVLRRGDYELPKYPDYVGQQLDMPHWPTTGFLVSGANFESYVCLRAERPSSGYDVETGDGTLYLLAYCDYIDTFGARHRVGWARAYDSWRGWRKPEGMSDEAYASFNNLEFVHAPGYNYERQREQGDGRDWDWP